jgi:hypothetical protein
MDWVRKTVPSSTRVEIFGVVLNMNSVECYEELYIHESQVSSRTCLTMVKSETFVPSSLATCVSSVNGNFVIMVYCWSNTDIL